MRLSRVWRLALVVLGAAAIAVIAGSHFRTVVQAQDNLTPGMLFGPLKVREGQHLELCASYLEQGDLTMIVHFRNVTTGEVTAPQEIFIPSGGGNCAVYVGRGRVVGLARGEGAAADWVSPSNALIGTMSVVDELGTAQASVLGVPKLWLRGL
jgi:hypothetical protein